MEEAGLMRAIRRFYNDFSLSELRSMHQNQLYPNISYNGLLYLELIDSTPHCTASHLAEVLRISKPAVTAKVNELIRQGFVQRRQSKDDKRVYHLTLAPAIQDDFLAWDKPLEAAARKLEADYSPQQITLFITMLDTYRKEALNTP